MSETEEGSRLQGFILWSHAISGHTERLINGLTPLVTDKVKKKRDLQIFLLRLA